MTRMASEAAHAMRGSAPNVSPSAAPDRAPRATRTAAVAAALLLAGSALAGGAGAQTVKLEIKPHVGDTLRMRLDQRVEMSGTTRLKGGDTTAAVVTTLVVVSRAFVERRDRGGTIVLASTDSVSASSNGADSAIVAQEARRALQGMRVRLRIAPDGATELADDTPGAAARLHAIFSEMPATLPEGEIAVGGTWTRAMVLPVAGDMTAGRGAGTLKARFRLDSLSRTGDMAYVSLVGSLERARNRRKELAADADASGSLVGSLIVDRRRGWITDARMTYTIRSVMTPPNGNPSSAMRFRMKITQWMRAVP